MLKPECSVVLDFYCPLGVKIEVVVTAPGRQCLDFLPVWCLIIVVNQPHYGCIIRKFDEGVGAMGGDEACTRLDSEDSPEKHQF